MYSNQSFDEKVTGVKRNDDYDICNTETGQKFVIKWSPQDGTRYLSKNRYASPRSMSKSVPRRKRGIVRYNINRSLNFDVGTRRSDTFRSPNSSSDSNVSVEGENYLSRSAKILRALNINYSPLQSTRIVGRRINKSLNFDLSPSPKRLGNIGKNASSTAKSTPTTRINKTLNFDTSSNDSNVNSAIVSSPESIDENQNQTPSQRNRSAKKSLNYPSPSSVKSHGSNDSNFRFSNLRSGLREKVDGLVRKIITPKVRTSTGTRINEKIDCLGAGTPRNLLNDYDDDNDDYDDDDRPRTPENFVRIIPESMSAIKKSHKKERVLGRIEKSVARSIEPRSGSEEFVDAASDTAGEDSRPATPLITIDRYRSPQCAIGSIKQSHKKNKSKKNLFARRSDDESSDDESIFGYTGESIVIPKTVIPNIVDENERYLKLPEIIYSHADDDNENLETREGSSIDDDPKIVSSTPETEIAKEIGSQVSPEASINVDRSKNQRRSPKSTIATPEKSINDDSSPPLTPENRINFLQRVMSDSIKKSHKKIKDTNRKTLFRPLIMRNDNDEVAKVEVANDVEDATDGERASTPENTNSSRLLLSQFSSVKKSHRKDKHRRMLTGSLRRKKFRTIEGTTNSDDYDDDDEISKNVVASLSSNEFSNREISTINLSTVVTVENSKIDVTSVSSNDDDYRSFESTQLNNDVFEMDLRSLATTNNSRSSPKKRKNSIDVSSTSLDTKLSSDRETGGSVEYESAEEEFKIFTPIKKRKSLGVVVPAVRRICDGDNDDASSVIDPTTEESTTNGMSRCSTPMRNQCEKIIDDGFKTPDRRASGVFVAIANRSSPVERDIDRVEDPSGRSTPQNSSTLVLMAGINSIKKSHKKDKRGDSSRRSLMSLRDDHDDEARSLIDVTKSSSQCRANPRASTSHENRTDRSIADVDNDDDDEDDVHDDDAPVKTPPNCLRAKTYMRMLQTSSIKRSHKKVRDRKKFRSLTADAELSDDGSLFDEAEKSAAMENASHGESGEIGDTEEQRIADAKIDFVGDDRSETVQCYHQDAASSRYDGNLSHDGSIFDYGEELESSREIVDSGEQASDPV